MAVIVVFKRCKNCLELVAGYVDGQAWDTAPSYYEHTDYRGIERDRCSYIIVADKTFNGSPPTTTEIEDYACDRRRG